MTVLSIIPNFSIEHPSSRKNTVLYCITTWTCDQSLVFEISKIQTCNAPQKISQSILITYLKQKMQIFVRKIEMIKKIIYSLAKPESNCLTELLSIYQNNDLTIR